MQKSKLLFLHSYSLLPTKITISGRKLPFIDPSPRTHHTSTLFKNYIITVGGVNDVTTKKALSYVTIVDLDNFSIQYTSINNEAIKPFWGHSACRVSDNQILLYGGSVDGTTVNQAVIMTITNTKRTNITHLEHLPNV